MAGISKDALPEYHQKRKAEGLRAARKIAALRHKNPAKWTWKKIGEKFGVSAQCVQQKYEKYKAELEVGK